MPVSPESEQRIGLLSYARHMREHSEENTISQFAVE